MKALIFSLMAVSATMVANPETIISDCVKQRFIVIGPGTDTGVSNPCIDQTEAEKILGHAARLLESTIENEKGIRKFRCTYSATIPDPETHKTSNLYYLLEEFETAKLSQRTYAHIVGQNQNMTGLEKINEIGDEAFLHTDDQNFLLIICRRGNKLLRIKVNKLTSKTSPSELKNFSKSMMASL